MLSVCLPAAVFDKNYKKLWRMEMYESTSDSTNRVRDPVPGSWFCLKEGYGAVYHPDGQPLWALLDTSAVEEWQRTALLIDDSGVVVLVSSRTVCICHDCSDFGDGAVSMASHSCMW